MDNYGFCRECGKVKEDKKLPYCRRCDQQFYERFKKIKAYLLKHPLANAMEISVNTNIPIERVTRYIKDELLKLRK